MQMNGCVRFAAKKRAHFTHRAAGCLGRRVGPDAAAKRVLNAAWSRRPVVQPISTLLTEVSRRTIREQATFRDLRSCGLLRSFFFHWHYSPLWALACQTKYHSIFSYLSPTLSIVVKSIQLFPLFDFRNNKFFTVWGC
jgi:hypothetical protein